MESNFYRRRRRRSSHPPIMEDIRQLPPPLSSTSNIVKSEPKSLKHESEEDNKGKAMEEERVNDYQQNEDHTSSEEEVEVENDSEDGEETRKQSKSERKSRKAILKLGFQPVLDVYHVAIMKKNKNVMYIISDPSVFKNPTSETYVIFGETSVHKISEMQSKKDSKALSANNVILEHESSSMVIEDEDVDVSGMDLRDIELVMAQTGLSWTNAAKALKEAENDIITAIMDHKMKCCSLY